MESEYSPSLMPDTLNFSSVRVEADAAETQRLWQFPRNRRSNGKPIFKYIPDVGYHLWMSSRQVALFQSTEPSTLSIADTWTDRSTHVAVNIGRTLKKTPRGHLAFVQKGPSDTWYLKVYNTRTKKSEQVIRTLPGSEDFTVLSDGTYLMANGSKLYKYHPAYDDYWLEVGDFRNYEILNISRLEVSKGGKLAMVAE